MAVIYGAAEAAPLHFMPVIYGAAEAAPLQSEVRLQSCPER
jgi:hypothetical protein